MFKANKFLGNRLAFPSMKQEKSRNKGSKVAIWLLAVLVFAFGLFNAAISDAQTFQWPVASPTVTQYYSYYNTTYGKYHAGMDITGNTAVYATASGTVRRIDNGTYVNENHNMGNVVIIDHNNGTFSLYAHLASISVANGQYVTKGTQIGIMGNTGTGGGGVHLHFEVKVWGVLGNLDDNLGPYWGYTTPEKPNWYGYVNPYPYLDYNINNISPTPIKVTTNQPIRTGPGTDYTNTFGTISSGQKFVAFSEYNGWYQIYIPSNYGSATGWIQGSIESSAIQAEVNDPARGTVGVSVRDNPINSANRITYVWDKQRLVILDQSSGSGCSNLWYKIYLPDGLSSLTGWVCGDYLSVTGGQTLSVSLTANPSSGTAPLNTNLTADVSGTATGTINYTFWWNCNDPGTSVSSVTSVCGDPTNSTYGAKYNGVYDDPKTVSHTYSSAGTYTAKVIAERGSASPAEARTTLSVSSAPTCTYSISPTSRSHGSGSETGSISVTAPSGCSWTATSSASWITITSGSSGSGNGTVNYSVAANTSTSSRTGTMTIAGQTFTVTQSGISCTYFITPTSQSFTSSGGTGSVNVTAPSGCSWTAVSNAGWITITSGSNGSGNGTVNYSVASNSSTSSRTGTINIQGQTFTVTQSGISCSYSITPTSASFTSFGGTGSVSVTAPSGCSWTATSTTSWITVTSGSSGSGNGTVYYSVASNTSTSSRTGTITITGGNTFTVTQSGTTVSDITVTPTTVPFGNVNIGSISDRTISVRNDGTANLTIGAVTNPSSPFSKVSDTCSNQTLSPSASCTITVRFSPSTTVLFSSSFNIPSNDPDENPVTVSLSGTGTPAGSPDIAVSPATTLSFPNILVGATADQTLIIKNEGSTNLTISSITSPSTPFSIVTDGCSNQTIAPTQSCTIVVRFAPTTSGSFTSSFGVPSNDPDENPVTISLNGSATPVTNNPPTKPTLTYPPNGSTGMPTTLTFIWNRCTDPDGDTVTYKLYIGTDPSFAGISPIIVASLSESVKYYAMVSGYPTGVIVLFGIVTIGGLSKRRKKIGFLILTVMFVIGLTLTSCGGGGGGGSGTPSDTGGTVSHTVSTLQKSTPYYWKVVADDGNGGVTESDTYSFTTGQ